MKTRLLVLFAFLANSSFASYSLDAAFEMAPPPRSGSSVEREDFEELRYLQENRTEDECEAAAAQARLYPRALFGPRVGVLSNSEFSAVEPLLKEVIETVTKEARPFKDRYRRKRPYDVDSSIVPCIPMPRGATSYPSSHAAVGVVLGHTLEKLFPGKRGAIQAEAEQIGQNRLIGGVHHPSDVEAGRDLGEQIWEALIENPDFQSDLSEARQALR